jgi:hypothetical protein
MLNVQVRPQCLHLRKWIWRIEVGFVAVLLGAIIVATMYVQYEALLRGKGEKLTWADLDFHSSTMGEALRILQVLTSGDFHKPEHIPAMERWVARGAARVSWPQTENWEIDPTAESGIAITNWLQMENEVAENASNVFVFHEILKYPPPDLGARTNSPPYMAPDFDGRKVMWVAQALAQALINDLHRQKISNATSHLAALINAANVNRDEPSQQGFRDGVGKVAVKATWEFLQATNWNDAQLAEIQNNWEDTKFSAAIQDFAIQQRMLVIEFANYVANLNASERVDAMLSTESTSSRPQKNEVIFLRAFLSWYLATDFNKDILFLLKYRQTQVETVRKFNSGTPWPAIQVELDQLKMSADYWLRKNKHYHFLESQFSIEIDPLPGFSSRLVKLETERRMALVAVVVNRYRIRHGDWPATLSATVPEIAAMIPTDPMTGKQFGYRVQPDGRFLLYSAGTDGRDDGGDANPIKAGDPPDFWNGRDAVWPNAAAKEQLEAARQRLMEK